MFANPWLLLGLVVGGLVALVASFGAGVRYSDGQNALATVAAKVQFDAKLAEANANARETERLYGIKLAQKDAIYQEQINATSSALANALRRTGATGLFVRAQCPPTRFSAVPGTAPAPTLGDGVASVRLSSSDGEFFIKFASECDRIADQLRAAQSILAAVR